MHIYHIWIKYKYYAGSSSLILFGVCVWKRGFQVLLSSSKRGSDLEPNIVYEIID